MSISTSAVIPWLTSNSDAAYPFETTHSSGISSLIADMYIVHSLGKLSGKVALTHFSNNNTPSAWDADVTLKLESGATLFDSLLSGTHFIASNFGVWTVFEWRRTKDFVKMIIKTSLAGSYLSVNPVDAYLLDRVIDSRPSRVETIRAINLIPPTTLLGTGDGIVELQEGYNISIERANDANTRPVLSLRPLEAADENVRNVNRLIISAVAGAGLGKYPSCNDAGYVSTLNGIAPDEFGDLILAAEGCVSAERPGANDLSNGVELEGSLGPTLECQDIVITDVPNKLIFHQDCAPCCNCDDYSSLYERIRAAWDNLKASYDKLVILNQDYQDLIDEWNAQPGCSKLFGRMRLFPKTGWTVGVHILVKNTQDCDVTNVTISTLTATANPVSLVSLVGGSGHIITGGPEHTAWTAPLVSSQAVGTLYAGRFMIFMCELYVKSHSIGQTLRVQGTLTTGNAGNLTFDETATLQAPFNK